MMTTNGARGKPATLVDVARQAGVSVSTAGRVLRARENKVDPKLAKRVLDASDKLGYVPNLVARNLRGGQPGLVGLIVGDMLDPYFAMISEVVTLQADVANLVALVANMKRDSARELELCEKLWEYRVSGVILSGGGFDQMEHQAEFAGTVARMRRSGVEMVSLSERHLDVPTFSVDNRATGRLLAEHVLGKGHRDVAVVFGPRRSLVTQRRLEGILEVLASEEIHPEVQHVEYTPEEGARVADHLVLDNPRPPTVIIAGSDSLATGITTRLIQAGTTVPDAVSVVGVGNTYRAELCVPPLTTVDVALAEAAHAAVQYLAERLRGQADESQPLLRTFPPRLIERNSVTDRRAPSARPLVLGKEL